MKKVKKSDGKLVKSITINYEDGTVKDIDKAMVVTSEQVDEEVTMSMEFCNIAGPELAHMLCGIITILKELRGMNDERYRS